MKKLGVTLLVCLVLVFLTGLTNVVVAATEDLGGTSAVKTTTDPGTDPILYPVPDPTHDPDESQNGDPYWDDGITP